MNDLFVTADAEKSSVLVLLGLSADSNTGDHSISLEHVQHRLGIY